MAVPKNKEELIFEIENNYSKLKKDLESIPTELTKEKELEGHAKETKMSVSDLVAYLVGWSELVLKWNHRKDKGQIVEFPETGFKWNELGKLAQKFYSDYENFDYKTILTELDRNVGKILELIKTNDNADLYEKPWYEKWTKGKMIQLNTSSPYKNARSRVRKWKKQNEEKIRTYNKELR
ncbi:ClbS/DfsB family four-helix bundle protein [Tenacibaculum sp. SSH1-16]|uniref:ClbS/DfsB family four-helix bundle protein n=1 Tax=Tenacibaculum sp. SSH1-16 TaxID=3136667 RepID=UPI0032C48775